MTPAEKCYRAAADKADAWAEKAEAAGRLEDAAALVTLAAAAKEKADALAKGDSALPAALRDGLASDPSGTSCSLCGSAGRSARGGLMSVCPNPGCIRHGVPVASSVF